VVFPDFYSGGVETELYKDFDLLYSNDNSIPRDGFILDYNTPLDLRYTYHKGNMTCEQFLNDRDWNLYYYSKLNENTPCLDLEHRNKVKHLSVHNLYGYQHTRMVSFKTYQ